MGKRKARPSTVIGSSYCKMEKECCIPTHKITCNYTRSCRMEKGRGMGNFSCTYSNCLYVFVCKFCFTRCTTFCLQQQHQRHQFSRPGLPQTHLRLTARGLNHRFIASTSRLSLSPLLCARTRVVIKGTTKICWMSQSWEREEATHLPTELSNNSTWFCRITVKMALS